MRRLVENFSPCVGAEVSTSAWKDPKIIKRVHVLADALDNDELMQVIHLDEDVVDSTDDFPWSERLYEDHGWHAPEGDDK